MKKRCEKCKAATGLTDAAFICSYECTFCQSCAETMAYTCPNCQGNLVLRPTRTKNPVQALVCQIQNNLRGS
ncbi:MAG: DUF1272 domain-containing protein [Planctomycetota bacterium]